MTVLAPTLELFFTQRLITQRHASPHTVIAYRDTFRLLLGYLHNTTGTPPARLQLEDLDAPVIGAFLDHLEHQRGNAISTRNARLAALRSFFRFAALRHPDHAALIQRVLAIPAKRTHRGLVCYLTQPEIDALLAAPDPSTRTGRRDHALLVLAIQTGLRVSELIALRRNDIELGAGGYLHCTGKGRKDRCTPLTAHTRAVLRIWLKECADTPEAPVFPGPRCGSLGRDAVRRLIAKHAATAARTRPSLATKRISPHVTRHSCAMQLLQSGVDTATIALWLGHESSRTTDIYLSADLELKERALARTRPAKTTPGRYRPPDTLLAFLENL
jgi:site-specific recombinase XerD